MDTPRGPFSGGRGGIGSGRAISGFEVHAGMLSAQAGTAAYAYMMGVRPSRSVFEIRLERAFVDACDDVPDHRCRAAVLQYRIEDRPFAYSVRPMKKIHPILHSPPPELHGFQQTIVIRPNRRLLAAETLVVCLALGVSLLALGSLVVSRGARSMIWQIVVFSVLWQIAGAVVLHFLGRRPRYCVFCDGELTRMHHFEHKGAYGWDWGGRLFVCRACRKYEALMSSAD